MSERYTRFTIGHGEETDCPQCGWPIDKGDRAVLIQSDALGAEYVACSKACHGRALRQHEQLEENEQRRAVAWEA